MDNQTKTIELTAEEREEICFVLRHSYLDYDVNVPESWCGIKKYNDMLDRIIEKVK